MGVSVVLYVWLVGWRHMACTVPPNAFIRPSALGVEGRVKVDTLTLNLRCNAMSGIPLVCVTHYEYRLVAAASLSSIFSIFCHKL